MTTEQLTDKNFIQQFEQLTLNPQHFAHHGHLRIAWLYLQRFDFDTALEKVKTNIKAYAESLGAHEKFHFTITDALTRIMANRIKASRNDSWPDFLEHNPDLFNDALGLLYQHYNQSTLFSNDARVKVIAPDIKAIS